MTFCKTNRSCFLLALVLLLLSLGPAGVRGQAPELPFRTAPDGRVNFQDLMKLSKQPATRDRINDVDLEAIKQEHQIEYGRGFKPTDAPKMPPRNDLYANSVILSDGVNHTLLPLQCLMHVPEIQAGRVVEEPVGKLILWPEFLKHHRSWLRSQEITLEVARGDIALSPEKREVLKLGNAIVVAVYRDNPISMLPPKEPAVDPALQLTMKDGAPQGAVPGEESGEATILENGQSKAEAAESLTQVEKEAKAMAQENQDGKPASSGRQGSTFQDRTKSRFGRFSK